MLLIRHLIEASVRNPVVANLLGVFFIIAGYYAAQDNVREVFPEVALDHIAVEVVYPGASPLDVETAVCTPIEEAVEGLPGVKEISSSANEGYGTVWLALNERVKDVDAKINEVKDRVDQITTFPPEIEEPVVKEALLRSEVIDVAVYGQAPERTLRRLAQDVRDDLLRRPEISQVALQGVRDEEIVIEVSAEALTAYNISLAQVMEVVARSSLNLPAGVIRTEEEELTLRVTGQRYTARDYEDLVVLAGEQAVVRLGDLATVREGFEDVVSRGRFNGQPAVVVAVYKTPDEDAVQIAQVVRDYVSQRQANLPEAVRMSVWADGSRDILGRTNLLISNGLWGLVVLFLALGVILGMRYAVWVCADIPMCFAGALAVMWFFDQTINMVSLFALIMVGGIIVDDSLVIAESVHMHARRGLTPELAAIEGTYRMAAPVLGATITSVVMFVPLLFVSGVMGKFVYAIPIVIIATLLVSQLEAFCILPSHLCHRERTGALRKAQEGGRLRKAVDRGLDYLRDRFYRPAFARALDNRVLTLGIATAVLLLAVGFVVSGRQPFVMLPKEDGSILRARVSFPEGTPASLAARTIERMEQAAWALNGDEVLRPAKEGALVRQVYSIAGEFADFLAVRGSHLCEVRIELMPPEERQLDDDLIIARWREQIGPIPDAVQYTIERQFLGPTDRPIEVRLLGDDLEQLAAASERVQEKLRTFAGVTSVHSDLTPGKRELRVTLKSSSRMLGLTLQDVAQQLRYGFFGGEAVRLQRDWDEVKVRVRYPEAERASIEDLETLRVKTPTGQEVPFLEVANVRWARGHAQIMHQDGQRRVRVFADIDERTANARQIVEALEAGFLQDVVGDYDEMSYAFGGDRKHADESLASLWEGSVVAVIIMYAVLAAMMASFVQPLVVMITVPFGLIGSIIGHMLLGYDLTLMSAFGLVAVSGIVVNHSLVIVDAMNFAIKNGKNVREALIEAGEVRFQAVVLSSITDVAALGPLFVRAHGQAESVMPMAISLTFGLMFSTVVTLFIVPAMYLAVNDLRRLVTWLRHGGTYPAAEAVEEAYRQRGDDLRAAGTV